MTSPLGNIPNSDSANKISYVDLAENNTHCSDGSDKSTNHGGYKVSKFCLQVFGISPNVSEENLTGLFSQCGNLISLRIHSETNGSPYALVEYADAVSAITSMKSLDGQALFDNIPFQ